MNNKQQLMVRRARVLRDAALEHAKALENLAGSLNAQIEAYRLNPTAVHHRKLKAKMRLLDKRILPSVSLKVYRSTMAVRKYLEGLSR